VAVVSEYRKVAIAWQLQFDRQQDENVVYDDENAVATAILARATTAIHLLKTTRAAEVQHQSCPSETEAPV